MVELARAAKFTLPTTDPDALRRFMLVSDAGSLEDYLAPLRVHHPAAADARGDRAGVLRDGGGRGARRPPVPRGALLPEAEHPRRAHHGGGARGRAARARAGRAGLRRDHPGDQLLAAALRARGVARDRPALGGAIATAGSWPSTWRAARRAGRPACTRRRSTSRPTAASASRCTPARPRAPSRSPRRSTAATPIASATAPGCTRIRCCATIVRDRRIPIEINITSNVQTRAVARAAEHPVRGYFDAGLVVTLCTDGWLMTGVTLDRRVLAGAHRAGVHAGGDRPLHPQRLRQRVPALARAAGAAGAGDGRAGGAAVSGARSQSIVIPSEREIG